MVKRCLGWRFGASKDLFCIHWKSNRNLPNVLKFILEENASLLSYRVGTSQPMTFGNQWQHFARAYLKGLAQTAYANGQVINLFTVYLPIQFVRMSACSMQVLTRSKFNRRICKIMPHQGFSHTFHAILMWFGTSTMVELISQKILKELIGQLLVLFPEKRKKKLWLPSFPIAWNIFYNKINWSWCIPGNTWFWWITVFQFNLFFFPFSSIQNCRQSKFCTLTSLNETIFE